MLYAAEEVDEDAIDAFEPSVAVAVARSCDVATAAVGCVSLRRVAVSTNTVRE
jgi:hypothetical protein